ncbi:TetR/AcrR family transcriptional regulator [Catenulispora pinisilvae]|uniref:TetR/AcrR family transcriptional regulator n=1 Tax=Catenulispora pinisilvae TaxID=2705253 RepID=UPI001890FD26|nr:TetR/AcrR family transcriptional regulator [Catenulispora pinisilvae]
MSTRRYHSPRRGDAAAETREAILSSAHDLFLARGYTGVTIGQIAEAAGVAAPTVYSSVGNKPSILVTLMQPPLTDPTLGEILTELEACGDPRGVIDLTARGTRRMHERHWDLIYGIFYRDPPGEPAVKAVLDSGANDYAQRLGRVADRLVALDGLRAGLTRESAVDVLWFCLGPHAWITLVGERSWTFDRAQAWIADCARRELLKD